jgi:transposase
VYAHAVTAAAPTAVQVADRWHLLKNLSENMARYLDTQRSLITAVAGELNQKQAVTPIQTPNPLTPEPLISLPANLGLKMIVNEEAIAQLSTEKRYPKYGQVKSLQQQGYGRKTIARHLGLSRNTVRKYFAQSSFVAKVHSRRSNLAEFESYLRKRWGEGETCVKNLWKEIKPMGYNGCYSILADFLSKYSKTPNPHALPPAQKGTTYSSRSLSIALCRKEDAWKDEQKPFLLKLLQKSPMLDQASLEFRALMETKKGHQLESWCQKAVQLSLFKGFVRGIRQDFAAVQQAMTSTWSNGQTEGQVNRLKNIKRQMYGKADFDLLRLRVLTRSG